MLGQIASAERQAPSEFVRLRTVVQESWMHRCPEPTTPQDTAQFQSPSGSKMLELMGQLLIPLLDLVKQLLTRLPLQRGEPPAVTGGQSSGQLPGSNSASPAAEKGEPPSAPASGSSQSGQSSGVAKTLGAGFLWKPSADKEGAGKGKLVVLLPTGFTGDIASVELRSADGKRRIEKGAFSGVANGDREHWRFSKPGKEYPKDVVLRIRFEDGSDKSVTIRRPDLRLQT